MNPSLRVTAISFLLTAFMSIGHAHAQTSFNASGPNGGAIIPGWSSDTCNAGIEGAIRYNSATTCAEYCNGTEWLCPERFGFLVQTSITFNGTVYSASTTTDYGNGLSGADAGCLSNLTAQNWRNKALAGALTAARVTALLCDGTTCNQAEPNTIYLTAVAGNTALGGIGFLTDSSGRGYGNAINFSVDNFESASGFWSNRGSVDTETWSNGAATANHCTNWSSNSVGVNGRAGNANNTNASRWDSANFTCNTARYLLCLVKP